MPAIKDIMGKRDQIVSIASHYKIFNVKLRDVLIHDYMGISLKIVWNVVQNELPQLKIEIIELLD